MAAPVKLEDLPETGHVLLAHPTDEAKAQRVADREGLDYLLSQFVPERKMFILDAGAALRLTWTERSWEEEA